MKLYITREVVGERPVSEVLDLEWFTLEDFCIKFVRKGSQLSEGIPLSRIYQYTVDYRA